MLSDPEISILARDPKTTHRLNCNAFQQHGLTSAYGWQYATFYVSNAPDVAGALRYVCVARRWLEEFEYGPFNDGTQDSIDGRKKSPYSHEWQSVILRDYAQTTEDGHNTVSLGISEVDGRIHLVWDLHNDRLRYRRSVAGLAWSHSGWSEESFGVVENGLQPREIDGFEGLEVTYPRFVCADEELLFEYRIGRAGNGSTALCRYANYEGAWRWSSPRIYLRGSDCSPYTNGISYDDDTGKLWVTWTNRRFVELQREADLSGEASQQAGPNGPENNEDMGCIYSNDMGESWFTADGLALEGVIDSRDSRVIVRRIPRDSGIMNQEGQCVEFADGVHVLMRNNASSTGEILWKHHWMDEGGWHTSEIDNGLKPTGTGSRGKICCAPRTGDILFVIPGNLDTSLTVLRRNKMREGYGMPESVWSGDGYDGEPLIDEERLCGGDLKLSVMTRTVPTDNQSGDIVVLDWDVGQPDY